MKILGLIFVDVVKTSAYQYPFERLSIILLSERGEYKVFINREEEGCNLIAFLRADRERRFFISNLSSLDPYMPSSRVHWRLLAEVGSQENPDRLEVAIPQPKCVEFYYSFFSGLSVQSPKAG